MNAAQTHRSDTRVLDRRTVQRDHAGLVPYLRPGMRVLDVGCGTGAITRGIAEITGFAVGADRDASLLPREPMFVRADALALPFDSAFDVVTSARTLQWIGRPEEAIAQMRNAVKPGGRVVVLDYIHAGNSWEPEPPREFRVFYDAFLAWRTSNGWDNRIGDRLAELFGACGLTDVRMSEQDEVSCETEAALIWAHVAQSLGPRIVSAGFLTEEQRASAEASYRSFVQSDFRRQRLSLRLAVGTRAYARTSAPDGGCRS